MYLFLQGERKSGKTTMLHRALLAHERHIAGLLVQRMLDGEEQAGFCACPVSGKLPPLICDRHPPPDYVFLRNGRWDMAALERAMAEALRLCRAPSCRLVLLDEIGGLELASAPFMEALGEILSLGKPCIGVLKSRENLMGRLNNARRRPHLPDDYPALHRQLTETLTARGNVLTLQTENREQVRQQINAFLEAVF